MPTPPPYPSKTLPTSSPSSARLRRLAPSPVKIPPTPPRFVLPSRLSSATPVSAERGPRERDNWSEPEHDSAQVDLTEPDTSPSDDRHAIPVSPQSTQRDPLPGRLRSFSTGSNMSETDSAYPAGASRDLFAKHLPASASYRSGYSGTRHFTYGIGSECNHRGRQDTPDLDLIDPFRRISDSPEEYQRSAYDRPLPVLIAFNNDVFGTGRSSVQGSQSRNASIPVSDSSESSFGHIGMTLESRAMSLESRYASIDGRGPSASESCGTFGPREIESRQSEASSMCAGGDSKSSFTLSAYGNASEVDVSSLREAEESPRSRVQTRRDTPARFRRSVHLPFEREATPFLSPDVSTARAIVRPSPPSATSTNIFTPGYTVASRGRPSANISVDYSASPVPQKPLPSLPPSLPPSPRTTIQPASSRLRPCVSKASVASVDTLDAIYPVNDALPSPVPQTAKLAPLPFNRPPEVPLAAQIQHKHLSAGKHAFRRKSKPPPPIAPEADPDFPEHTRRALHAIPNTTTMTLMISQEGMREISCTLNFRRIHKPAFFREKERKAVADAEAYDEKFPASEMFQDSGCLEFGLKVKLRPKWTVHQSPMMGLPVLTRCTLNQEDRRDYLPRNATLQIKELGVYEAHGVEDKGRVEWRFEYLVQAKFSASTGELKPNERLVIPLGFYASPGFFNPDRASKLHIGNAIKRSVKPKTTSEPIRSVRYVPFPLLKPDGTPAYDHPAWIKAMSVQAAHVNDETVPELAAVAAMAAREFGIKRKKERAKEANDAMAAEAESRLSRQSAARSDASDQWNSLPSDEAMSRFYRGITPASPITPTSITSQAKQTAAAPAVTDVAPSSSGTGTMKRILRAVTSSRGSAEPFGAKSAVSLNRETSHVEPIPEEDESKPVEEKKTRKRAGTLLSRALGTGDSTKSQDSAISPRQDHLHAEPLKSPTASTHSQSALSRVLAPIKSYANLLQTTPAAAAADADDTNAAPTPSKKGKVHTMKSLSSLVGGNRSEGRPPTATETEIAPPPVPKIPSIIPISAHPFATHIVPIPKADIVSRPATAGTGATRTPEARWINPSTHITAYESRSRRLPADAHGPVDAFGYGKGQPPILHPAASRLVAESTKFHGMVIGQPILIAQNEQMAAWTSRGGFNGPRSGSRDSLKVPLTAPGIDEELKEGGRGLKPAPSKSGKGPLQGFRAGIGLRKRPNTADPGFGRA